MSLAKQREEQDDSRVLKRSGRRIRASNLQQPQQRRSHDDASQQISGRQGRQSLLPQQDNLEQRQQQTSHRGHDQSTGHEPLRVRKKQDSARRKENGRARGRTFEAGEVISGRDRGGVQRALPLKHRERGGERRDHQTSGGGVQQHTRVSPVLP